MRSETGAFDSGNGSGTLILFRPQAKPGELVKKFIDGNEMKCADAQRRRSRDILAHVVNKHGFLRKNIEFPERVMEDQRQRFTCAHAAGIDAHRKMTDKRVSRLDMRDVNRVCIGKQGQPAVCSEALKQELRQNRARIEDAAPDPAEFIESE